ncbi:GtrA family protein [Cohnella sp.]|uniref:GtrA family protein n=1 Tax=Cohnella sp. TaxID=1883426 RepID=UPI003566B0F2
MLRLAEGKRMVKYALVGGLNTGVDFAVFCVLVYGAGMASIWAQVLSYGAGLINSYMWNRSWTFQVKRQHKAGEIIRFLGVNLLSFAAATAMLLGLEQWGTGSVTAKAVSAALSLAVNYAGYRIWVFRKPAVRQGVSE